MKLLSHSYPSVKPPYHILRAEQVLQQAYGNRAIIIRPSGIYGKQRLMRVRKAKEAETADASLCLDQYYGQRLSNSLLLGFDFI